MLIAMALPLTKLFIPHFAIDSNRFTANHKETMCFLPPNEQLPVMLVLPVQPTERAKISLPILGVFRNLAVKQAET